MGGGNLEYNKPICPSVLQWTQTSNTVYGDLGFLGSFFRVCIHFQLVKKYFHQKYIELSCKIKTRLIPAIGLKWGEAVGQE